MNNKSKNFSPLDVVILLVVLAGVAFAGYQFNWFQSDGDNDAAAHSGPPPAAVSIAQARNMVMAPYTTLPGTVVSVTDAVIAAETTGKILSVAKVGDVIAEGDTIAEIDARNAKQMVAQAKANVERLETLYTYHDNVFARVEERDNKLGYSELGVAELQSNRDTAKADLARAKSALTTAKIELERTIIRAPFSGTIVSQEIQLGEFAQLGAPVVRLVDTNQLEISARVPAGMVQPIAQDTLLDVHANGQVLRVPLRTIVPVGDAVSRTMELRVTLNNSGLLVGSPVRVSLPSAAPKEVVAIPRDAVVLRANSQFVFVVDDDGKAKRVDVQLGYADGELIEVIGDVPANASVVIRGGERLRDGQAVAWDDQTKSQGDDAGIAGILP